MAIPKLTLYKHVKLDSVWRYCNAAWNANGKIKPNVVLVNDFEETSRERAHYLNHNNTWTPVGEDALDAAKERLKHRNAAEYHRLNGTTPPEQKGTLQPVESASKRRLTTISRKSNVGLPPATSGSATEQESMLSLKRSSAKSEAVLSMAFGNGWMSSIAMSGRQSS